MGPLSSLRESLASKCKSGEPVVVALPEPIVERMLEDAAEWSRCGFDIAQLAPDRIAVRSVPALLAREDVAALTRDMAVQLLQPAGADA